MKTDVIFHGRTLASIELGEDLDSNIEIAAGAVEAIINRWPSEPMGDLAPQPRLLCAARILSAVVRGCDSSKQNAWYFSRDPVLEDRIATKFLCSGGLQVISRMIQLRKSEAPKRKLL